MKFVELKKSLANGVVKPSYVLTGDDGYLIELAKNMLEGLVTNFPEMNLVYFKSSEATAQDLVVALESMPLLSEKKVVVADSFSASGLELENYLANPNMASVLVIVAPELTQNLSKIALKAEIVDCSRLDESFLKVWIAKNIAPMEGEITEEATKLLILFCNRYLARIRSELTKLVAYKNGELIESSDVEAVVTKDNEYKIFELSEAITKRDTKKVSDTLTSLTESGTPIPVFMGMLYSHFRRLLYCKITADKSQLPKELGVKDYAVRMSENSAKSYSAVSLKRICDCFHKMDYGFKNGLITDKLALETLIYTALQV